MTRLIKIKYLAIFLCVYVILCGSVVAQTNSLQPPPTWTVINWDNEEQYVKRYQYASSYMEQILASNTEPLDKQIEWGTQLSWCIIKGMRMSILRYMGHFRAQLSQIDDAKLSEEEKRYIEQEVERFNALVEKLSRFESILASAIYKLNDKIKGANPTVADVYLLSRGNFLLLSGGYKPEGITNVLYREKPHLNAAHRAMYFLFSGDKTASLKCYEEALSHYSWLKNRAETAKADYDVYRDMQQMLSLLNEANSILASDAGISEENEETLNNLYFELRETHERISYAPTQKKKIDVCNEWFCQYSGLLKNILQYSQKINNSRIHLLNKDNVHFLYFIAF